MPAKQAADYQHEWRRISDAIRHDSRLQMAALAALDDHQGVARTAEASEYAISAILGLSNAAARLDCPPEFEVV